MSTGCQVAPTKKSKPKIEEIEDKKLVPTEIVNGRPSRRCTGLWVQEFRDATKRFTVFTVTTAQTGSPGVVLHRPVFSENLKPTMTQLVKAQHLGPYCLKVAKENPHHSV